MAFTDYAQNPDGSYLFTDPTGQTLTAAGPAAWQKAQQIDLAKGSGATPAAPVTAEAQLNPSIVAAAAPREDQLAMNGPGIVDGAAPAPDIWHRGQAAIDKFKHDLFAPPKPSSAADIDKAEAAGHYDPAYADLLRKNAGLEAKHPELAGKLAKPEAAATAAAPAQGGAPAPGAAKVDPRTLVGAGGAGGASAEGQIPTVMEAAPGAGGVIKGGWRDAQKTLQQGKIAPESKAALDEDTVAERGAIQDMATALVSQNDAIGQAKNEALGQVSTFDTGAQAKEADRQARIEGTLDRLRAKNDELAKEPIDSEAFWHTKSQGEKFAAALAVGLGAVGSGLSGGPNSALNTINDAISRNIDAQKANLQNKRNSLQADESLLGQYRGILGDTRAAEAAARANLLQRGAQQIDAITANTQDPVILANATKAKADMYKEADRWTAEATKGVETMHSVNVPDQRAGGAAGNFVYDDVKKDQVVRGPDNRLYEFGEGATAQKAADQLGTINQQIKDNEILQDFSSNPANLADIDKRAEAKAVVARMVRRDAKAESGGNAKFNESLAQVAKDAMGGDPTALFNMGKSAALREHRAGLQQEANGLIGQHALSQVDPYRYKHRTGATELRFVRQGAGPGVGPDLGAVGARVGEK